jgi:choice-of-anchor C domain-containing protein
MKRIFPLLFLLLLHGWQRLGASVTYQYDLAGNLSAVTSLSTPGPVITAPPADQVVSENGTVYFSVIAAGAGPFTYQWLSNGVPIPGATGDVLPVPGVAVPTNVVVNGGFESPAVVLATVQTFASGQNLGGWMVESGSVEISRTYWLPDEGVQSLGLNGTGIGTVYQDLATVPGQSYYLHFALAGVPGSPVIKTNQVWWNGSLLDTVTFDSTGNSSSAMGWTNREYQVTASGAITRLRFASLTTGAAGPALDAVSLVPALPPPAAYSVIVSNSFGSVTSVVASIQFDLDANGLPDAWELAHFGATGQDPTADTDGDGVLNLDEYLEGTNPGDANSFRPRLHLLATPGGSFLVSPLQPSYALNQTVQLTASADPGYAFVAWAGDLNNTNAVANLVMNGHKTVVAEFGRILTNGQVFTGSLTSSQTNIYEFAANAGNSFILQIGTTASGNNSFYPQFTVSGPNGFSLSSAADASGGYVLGRATNSGIFMVSVTSFYSTGTGSYRLNLAKSPGAFTVSPGDEGGNLTNGAACVGILPVGDLDMWSFNANSGDNIVVQMGAIVRSNAQFYPQIFLYGPNGTLQATAFDLQGASLATRATNSGAFTVVVNSYYNAGAGAYSLNLAKSPGSFVVSPGDEGGPLTNGAVYTGTLPTGDLDMWTFNANSGDGIILQVGAIVRSNANFYPQISLYGPDGTLQANVSDVQGAYLVTRATNSGAFTVVVNSYYDNGAGSYWLNLAKAPGTFVVSPGDEGGTLTNGAAYAGTLPTGDLDMWTFNANSGDSIILQMGAIVRSNANFYPQIFLYGPNGILQANVSDAQGAYLVTRATNSGAFTVVVNSYYDNGAGSYWLNLAKAPGTFVVSPGDEGGTLTNGASYSGTLPTGDLDIWNFDANTGDNITLRMGAIVRSNANFYPQIFLFGPNGAPLSQVNNLSDTYLNISATNSGTFTVVVNSYYDNGSGTYQLNLAKTPGSFIVSPGDEGGALTNGGNFDGMTPLGDEDMWAFAANKGDNIVLRCADTSAGGSYYPWIRLYGPNGAALANNADGSDSYVAYQTTNSGVFTVLVGGYFQGYAGAYRLRFLQMPGTFIVPPGDEGGLITGGTNYSGVTDVADEDPWTFTAFKGAPIVLNCQKLSGAASYNPWIRLYGPDGASLANAASASTATINYTPTNNGVFTVLVGSYFQGYAGTYRLSGAGFSGGLTLGAPVFSGTNWTLTGSGGASNVSFVLFTTTNLVKPAALWTPVSTNHFNAAGSFTYTNLFNAGQPQQFFRLSVP